jgi:hypothetical protein
MLSPDKHIHGVLAKKERGTEMVKAKNGDTVRVHYTGGIGNMAYPFHVCIKHGKECPYFTNPVISSACCATRGRTA